jgi:peptidoglycan-associated lipoprotein
MTTVRFIAAVVLLSLAVSIEGCSSSPTGSGDSAGGDSGTATQAAVPDTGGIGAAPGTEQDFMLNAGRRTFFAEGSAKLDDTARVTLDKQAQWLGRYSQWKVKLQGFADDPGSETEQMALSQKRADAVKDYLIAQGIAPERIKAKGYGRTRLVGDCAEIECKAQNRRVITNPQDAPDF